ncbi:tetratricopeptide repeat protein [Congregibacter litoralis]|uniref:Putative integral membrane protein n=1 Tax=Congregibacter litoralis KT71 TaxID=314285 RepID=A4ABU3_9GAMM|nr:tetratricopeptide repeat protein [Congregibacter litoralis]EAQ96606.1 putative integral membrane protein [Congregibacter litoralis KT71]
MIKLIRELRQRRVFRGAGYYLLGAWGVLQVGDVIVEPAGLPGWSMTALLYLLILGFPIAMVLSWRYDIGEHGIVRTKSIGDDTPAEGLRIVDYLLLAGLVAVSGGALYQLLPVAQQVDQAEQAQVESAGPALADLPPNSIAVLPFADISQQRDQEFLGDGISDTVMHVLSQIADLSVTARTSSFAFKGQNRSVTEIASMLAVAHVLEGSVQRAGDKVRIIARLIDARVGTEVWSGYYDRTLDSIFAIQDEIAREVATALTKEVLKTGETQLVDNAYRPDLEAYEKFILGKQQMEQQSRPAAENAKRLFQEAIDIDPNYAMAYVMLANAQYQSAGMQGRQAMILSASELVAEALDLDPQLAEAHGMSALLLSLQKRNAEARAAVDRAIELRPSYARAYATLASLLYAEADFDGALAQIRKAIELDPQEDSFRLQLARSLWSVSRAEEAVAMVKESIKRNPGNPSNYGYLARWSGQLGDLGRAAYWQHQAALVAGDDRALVWRECSSLLQLWALEKARSCLDGFLENHPDDVEAKQFLAVATDDVQAGIDNLKPRIEANPNLWYRRYQLSDWLIAQERWTEVVEILTPASPGLLGEAPKVQDQTVWAAVNLATAYRGLGQEEKARVLSEAGLAFIDQRRKLQASGYVSGIEDSHFLMLLGREDEALERLNRSVAAGWRFFSVVIKFHPLYDPVRDDPEFQRAIETLEEDMAEQLAWYEAHRDDPIESVGI